MGGGGAGWANARWLSNYSDHAQSMRQLLAAKLSAKTFHADHGGGLPYGDAAVAKITCSSLKVSMCQI